MSGNSCLKLNTFLEGSFEDLWTTEEIILYEDFLGVPMGYLNPLSSSVRSFSVCGRNIRTFPVEGHDMYVEWMMRYAHPLYDRFMENLMFIRTVSRKPMLTMEETSRFFLILEGVGADVVDLSSAIEFSLEAFVAQVPRRCPEWGKWKDFVDLVKIIRRGQ